VPATNPRWHLAQQVYNDAGHYEYDSMPNWAQLRQKASDELNKLFAKLRRPLRALTTLNGDLNALLQVEGVG